MALRTKGVELVLGSGGEMVNMVGWCHWELFDDRT